MSLYLFTALAFVFSFIILFAIKPTGGEFIDSEIPVKEIPQIIFRDFEMFDIGKNGIVETTLSGEIGEGFRNGSYRIRGVEMRYQNSEYVENIKSRYAYYNGTNIEATNGVFYQRSDNSSIQTDKLSYDIEHRYFYIPNSFIFKRNGMIIKGKSLIIDREIGKIKAFKIDAIVNKK